MPIPATVALAIFGAALLCSGASATPPPPRAGSEPGVPAPGAKGAAAKDADAATPAPKKPPPRRAVRQQLGEMPRMAGPPPAYVPPPAPPALVPPAPPMPIAAPQAQDGSYKGGVGTTLLSPQGKVCSNNGITVQCF